jgi:pimeloyl-ACP methyl ester carboxylesterase
LARIPLTCWLAAGWITLAAASSPAQEQAASPADAAWVASLQRAAEALEWSDELVRQDWRLQRRPTTDAARILDPTDRCVHEGDRDACLARFRALETEGRIPAVRGPTVIVLHGLGEGRSSMQPLVEHLRNRLDANVLSFGYASSRAGIDEHGRSLDSVVAGLPDADRISFVGHSLGNLVVRRWMSLAAAADLARAHRMVMLGAPNQGSDLARLASRFWILASLADGAARDLVVDWAKVSPTLAVPSCPFGIVAGGKGDDRGYSSLLAGDDDAVVRVEETRLEGEDDFLLVPVNHAAMMKNPTVQQATVSFLETGRFPDDPPGAGR